ncbi:hypothetical protein CJ030_MR7G014277 [Morella rubra]|uniref:Uncharacterized protein n=1 Tax=Morella rubra TaxID=262757 RepID=A0A6A1V0F3_9ROSI|nr:hypothetical protein CJ030_MR7G014277 [Morella rubra]
MSCSCGHGAGCGKPNWESRLQDWEVHSQVFSDNWEQSGGIHSLNFLSDKWEESESCCRGNGGLELSARSGFGADREYVRPLCPCGVNVFFPAIMQAITCTRNRYHIPPISYWFELWESDPDIFDYLCVGCWGLMEVIHFLMSCNPNEVQVHIHRTTRH